MKDFLDHLQKLVTSAATARELRQSYRSCHWLVDFDDFCQRVLLHAIEHFNTFRGQTTEELLSWLRALGRQLAAQLRRAAHASLAQALLPDVADRVRTSAAEEVVQAAERATDARWLARAIAALDLEDSGLLQRHYWGRESLAAIALDLGLLPNTVTQRHGRLLQRLRAVRRVGGGKGASSPESVGTL
jgi:RNA polymerase sigma factor (sigma-70 family)